MADNARVVIAKLNNSNYQVWKYKLELLLIKEDLWEIVSEEKPVNADAAWLKRDGKARATIGLLVEDNQLTHVRKEDTAKGAWDSLKRYHQKSTLTSKVFLLKRLCRLQLTEDGNMENHINIMLELVDQLAALGEELADNLIVALILCSLPESYETLITALESRPEEDLTLELIKGKLINEYKRRLEVHVKIPQQHDAALKVQSEIKPRSATKGEFKKNTSNMACYFCQKKGHLKRDCRQYKAQLSQSKGTVHKANKAIGEKSEVEESHICFRIGQSLTDNKWCIDSGATCHMTNDKSFFNKFEEIKKMIHLANGQPIEAIGKGDGILKCTGSGNNTRSVIVKDALFVPDLEGSLLSVDKLTKAGLCVEFSRSECKIIKDGELIATASPEAHLYKLDCVQETSMIASECKNDCIHAWHRRFGHRSPDGIRALVTENLATGIDLKNCKNKITCDSCIRGKMSRLPFPKESQSRSKNVMDLIHTDVCGPMQTVTPGGKKYVLTLIDDFSRYTTIYLLEKKSAVFDKFQEFVQMAETKFQRSPKAIRSDRGGEYTGANFINYLKQKGIEMQTTAPYSPQQNGVAERKNRSLLEMARCMLIDAKMDIRFWGEAVNTSNYLQNRLPTKRCDRTPYENWNGRKPNLGHLQIFGSEAYAMVPKERSKVG